MCAFIVAVSERWLAIALCLTKYQRQRNKRFYFAQYISLELDPDTLTKPSILINNIPDIPRPTETKE